MPDRIAQLEDRVDDLERRLQALEGVSAGPARGKPAPEPSLDDGFVASASVHIGRVLLIFGGAYLLRAVTDFQFVPTAFGIFLGASYALVWLYMALRTARREDQRAAAAFYGITSVLLALPLLFEAHDRFELLSAPQSVAALFAYSTLALGVGAVRELRSLFWLATVGGIVTAVAFLIVSHAAIPVVLFLLAQGLATLWIVYARHWLVPHWIGAVGANGGVALLIALSGNAQWSIGTKTPAVFALVLLVAYLGSFAIRSHRQGRDLGVFEAVQALAVVGIAFAASVAGGVVREAAVGGIGLVFGITAYLLAAGPETRRARGRNHYFYSTLGLFLVLGSAPMLAGAQFAAAAWALLAVAFAWVSGRTGRVSLSLQCAVLLLAAGMASGMLTAGLIALAGDGAAGWPVITPRQAGIVMATVACLFIPVAQKSGRWGAMAGLPQLVVLALSVWEVGGGFVAVAGPGLAGAGNESVDPGVLAALRTAVLCIAACTLALSSRFARWPEARWLVYPVLVIVGVKLFAEDFPHGQPATLFVALAFIGGALLLVARLLTRRARQGE